MEEIFIYDLPKALNEIETIKYLKLIKEGDQDARDKFIIHNIRLVIFIINKYFRDTPFEKEELLSIGIIGLIKSVNKFDLSRNIKFNSYATVAIRNEIAMHFRKNKIKTEVISLDKNIGLDENDYLTIKDKLPDETIDIIRDYEIDSEKKGIRQLINMLSEKERDVISMYFGISPYDKKYSQREIGEKYNTSQKNIEKLIKKTLIKLKNLIIYYGYIDPDNRKYVKK